MKNIMFVLAMMVSMVMGVQAKEVQKDVSWTEMSFAMLKMMPNLNYEAVADEYLSVFDQKTFDPIMDNEFKLQKERPKTIEKMKEVVSKVDLNKELSIRTTFKIGQYDFTTKTFPMVENFTFRKFGESAPSPFKKSVFVIAPNILSSGSHDFFTGYRLSFPDDSMVKPLAMSEEDAEKFVTKRTQDGVFDRTICGIVYFKLDTFDEKRNAFTGKFTKIQFFEDTTCKKELLTQDYTAQPAA